MGGLEEFFEVFGGDVERIAGFGAFVAWLGEFDGANWAQGVLITEDEIDVFVLDEALGGLAILGADFVIEERRNFDPWDDVKFLAKKFDQELKTKFFGAFHETFAGAIAGAGFEAAAALTDADAGEDGHEKQRDNSDDRGREIDLVGTKQFLNVYIIKHIIVVYYSTERDFWQEEWGFLGFWVAGEGENEGFC